MQTRFHSFIEVMTSTIIGYISALISQWIIFPLFGIYNTLGENMMIAAWFTVISIIRSYVVHRWFNHIGSDLDDFLARIFVRFRKDDEWQPIGNVKNLKINGKEVSGKGQLLIKKHKTGGVVPGAKERGIPNVLLPGEHFLDGKPVNWPDDFINKDDHDNMRDFPAK